MGEELIGTRIAYQRDGREPVVGIARAVQPRQLVDVETGIARPAVRFQIETDCGALVWTDAVAA